MRFIPFSDVVSDLGFAVLLAALVGVSATVGAVEPNTCDSNNGPCDCIAATQLPNQTAGVTGFAIASNNAMINDEEDSCAGVGQCAVDSTNHLAPGPGRTAIQLLADDNPDFGDDNASAVVGISAPNPVGLSAALADLDSYRVSLCSPIAVLGVDFNLEANQAADYTLVPGAPEDALGPYQWIDFFVVLTLSNGDRVIGYEQHGIDLGCGDAGGCNAPIIGSMNKATQEGISGGRSIFFDQQYEITDLTFYFDGSGGFAYFGGSSVAIIEDAILPSDVCDATNGPCSCDPAEQLPLQSAGVSGYATMSNDASINENEDSCGGVGQCIVASPNSEGGSTGRSAIQLKDGNAGSMVVNDTSANPAGLSTAIAQLDSYRINLCQPVTSNGVEFLFNGAQNATFGDLMLEPYSWIDFFVVVTDDNGDNFIAYEQHGIDSDCGNAGGCNAPLIGASNRVNEEGLQGGRTIVFDRSFEATAVSFFFDGSSGFAYFGGSTVKVLESIVELPDVCDDTNGPCDCDPAEQLPNQSDGVSGYATMSNDAPINQNEDSCGGVGQCLVVSPNTEGGTTGRSAIKLKDANAVSAVVNDTGPNPEGLALAILALDSYSVQLCDPLTVNGVKYTATLNQQDHFNFTVDPYSWLDFLVVVTDDNGDNFIAYEQHGIDLECADPGGCNAPLIGSNNSVNAEGTQGDRELFFDQSFNASAVTFYFDGSSGFAYFAGASVVLSEAGNIALGECDDTNGPCSCDPEVQLPLQSAGVTGFATTSNPAPAFDLNADSSQGVGQSIALSPNNLPFVPDGQPERGRTAIVQTTNNASSMVVGDTNPNPAGLDAAIQQLDFYSVELCNPLEIRGVNYVASLSQETQIGDGPYTWLDFFVVLTLTNGERVIAFEQHGIDTGEDCGEGDEGGCNNPIIGTISNLDQEGTQGGREITFDQAYEVTGARFYYDGSSGFSYWGGATVELVEGPSATLVVRESSNSTMLSEDVPLAVDTFTVKLGQAPSAEMEIELTFDADQIDVFPDTLTFDENDFDVEKTVTVSVFDDNVQETSPHTTLIGLATFGGGFDGVMASVTVSIIDNDEPAPTGACCTAGSCDIDTQAACEAGGGTYQGDGSDCGGVECPAPGGFRRGDHDGSGLVDITDPLNLLGFLFLGQTPPICEDASDGDNSGLLDISDALNILGYLFLGSFPLNETLPGPTSCGPDPTVEIDPDGAGGFPPQPATSLGCDMYPSASGTACQ